VQSQDDDIKRIPVQGQTRNDMVLKIKLGKSPGFFFALSVPATARTAS
jgi:hypothetical protein